jgi:hypothetical protein
MWSKCLFPFGEVHSKVAKISLQLAPVASRSVLIGLNLLQTNIHLLYTRNFREPPSTS